MQTSRHNIAVPCMARAYRAVHYHDSSVRVCNSKSHRSLELWIIGKNRSHQGSRAAPCDLYSVFHQVIRKNRCDRAKNLNLVDCLRLKWPLTKEKSRFNEATHTIISIYRLELVAAAEHYLSFHL